jgi:hypothetical protein
MAVLRHKDMGWIALVGYSVEIWYWIGILSKVARLRLKVFSNFEAAADFVQELG